MNLVVRGSCSEGLESFLHPSFRKMTSDHIHASFIYLEPIKRNFHLCYLIIIVHIPNRHSAFFIKQVLSLPTLPSLDFAIFITSKRSVILSCDSSILVICSFNICCSLRRASICLSYIHLSIHIHLSICLQKNKLTIRLTCLNQA